MSVEILNEDLVKSLYTNDSKDMHDTHCSKLLPDALCELTNMQSYVAQEPESAVRSQLYSIKSYVSLNKSVKFDLQLIISFLVVITIVHTCKYLLYTSNTPPWFPAKGLRIGQLNIIISRIISGPVSKLSVKMYNLLYKMYNLGIYNSPWLSFVKSTLVSAGFGYVLRDQKIPRTLEYFKKVFKTRLKDQYLQTWTDDVASNAKSLNYRMYKSDISLEFYINYEIKNRF